MTLFLLPGVVNIPMGVFATKKGVQMNIVCLIRIRNLRDPTPDVADATLTSSVLHLQITIGKTDAVLPDGGGAGGMHRGHGGERSSRLTPSNRRADI